MALNEDGEIIGYEFVNLGKMMEASSRTASTPTRPMKKNIGTYGRFARSCQVHRPATRNKEEDETMALFESYERRIDKIERRSGRIRHWFHRGSAAASAERYGLRRLRASSRASSPSALKTPVWAYTLGAAIAVKKGVKTAADAAEAIGDRPAGLLHPRLRGRRPKGGPGPRQPGRHAAAGRDQVLRLPGRPRVLRRRRRRHRHRPQRQQGPSRSLCGSS